MRPVNRLLGAREVRPHHDQKDEDENDEKADQTAEEQPQVPPEPYPGQRRTSEKYHPESVWPKKSAAKKSMPRKMPKGSPACIRRPRRTAAGRPSASPLTAASS